MSSRFPCACPRAKQIVGQKSWLGWAGGFAFPGFKANWVNTYSTNWGITGGAWQFTADGGAMNPNLVSGSPVANFAAGDLVLREYPANFLSRPDLVGPIKDYLTGLTQSYPKFWWVYKCMVAITGSATDPYLDTAHFALWNWFENNTGQPPGNPGPSGWPGGMGGRALFAQTPGSTAQMEFTVTTELDNFPLFPATLSGLKTLIGANNDSAAAWADPSVQEAAAAGTFAYDWTFANNYDGTAATYTPPATAPSSRQAHWVFPRVPLKQTVNFDPRGHYEGSTYIVDSLYSVAGPGGYWPDTPSLVSWTCSASAISFKFAAWSYNYDVNYGGDYTYEGQLASAPATITQTWQVSGASYRLSDVAAQAQALRDATSFDSIDWRTSWTNTYNGNGAVVSTQNTVAGQTTQITESGQVGTPVQWGVAINGCPFKAGATTCFSTKALVDICGNYCTRTYAYGTSGPTACANGNINGYAPVILAAPATAGQSQGIYNGVQCG